MIQDFRDLLAELVRADARFLVVGRTHFRCTALREPPSTWRASGRTKDLADIESLGGE